MLVAVVNGTTFNYINNESDETIWPGKKHYCLVRFLNVTLGGMDLYSVCM